ncbi:MAG TPA: ABC transporter permease, partial [Candidatus Dormibacteraeota bacterium]|nr:ABC transporter permease [Candidatus Dormibacteraeota bacterium]
MSSKLGPLLVNEMSKAVRRKLPWFGVFAVAVLCGLIFVVADQVSAAASANAWGYAAFSMHAVFSDIGLIVLLVFSSMLMAEETGTGTIRAALAAPIHRWELYVAKAITGLAYMLFISLCSLLFSLLLARIHFQFGDVTDALGVVYNKTTVLKAFAMGVLLSWVPLAALLMYGLFISTLVRSSGAAVAVAICTMYLLDFTKHLLRIDPYIFTKYIGYPWQVLQQMAQGVDY